MTQSDTLIQTLQNALAQHQAGNLIEAEKLYKKVLTRAPNQPDALNLLGVIAADKGDVDQAIQMFDRAIEASPTLVTASFNKGNALRDAERPMEAKAAYESALARDPDFDDARLNLGVLLHMEGLLDEALKHFNIMIDRAPQGHPNQQKAHYNVGKCLHDQGNLEAAETALLAAVNQKPDDADAHFAISNVYADLQNHQAAVAHIKTAIQAKPDWPEAHANWGNFLCALDKHTEALPCYDTSLNLAPDNATTRVNRGITLLSQGRFAEGWPDYKYRAQSDAPFYRNLETTIPPWNDDDITEKTVLVWHEQGLGEEILFAGLIKEFAAQTRACTLLCSAKLKQTFERSFKDIENLTVEDDFDAAVSQNTFDIQTSMVELGRFLRPSSTSFPTHAAPYLRWDGNRANALRERLKSQHGGSQLLVGISWSSANPIIGQTKSVSLDAWLPILSNLGMTFVNLQYGAAKTETSTLPSPAQQNIVTVEDIDLDGDLDDTLSLSAAMDHIITCSNTTAHLACAAGLLTSVLVPKGDAGLWYWLTSGHVTPWYPSARIYRKGVDNDATAMMNHVREDLAAWAGSKHI